jgi:tRNA pseudouridine38-40 synthase
VQPDKRTVQGDLCSALSETLGVPCKVTGCSRTDSGVHANEFCITVDAEGATVPADKLPVASAKFLPEDISLFYAKECDDNFHPRYDADSKEYLYRIYNSKVFDPFEVGRSWFLPRIIDDEAFKKMEKAAKSFVGKKDFSAFMAQGSDAADTVREVKYLELERQGELINLRICADGFLYNMVRIIVGTLTEVAFGRISAEDICFIIESKNRALAGMTAPADGLYLNRVFYKLEKQP